jgi:hypothetical protein
MIGRTGRGGFEMRRGTRWVVITFLFAVAVLFLIVPRARSWDALVRDLEKSGPAGKASFESCVFGGIQAGLLLNQALEACRPDAARLADLASGVNDLSTVPIQVRPDESASAAGNVAAACGGGDPRVSAGDGGVDPDANYQDASGTSWYCSGDVCTHLEEPTLTDNRTLWEKIKDYFSGDDDAEDAGAERTSGENACMEAIAEATRVLSECNRTGWQNGECQALFARLNGCADPGLIYVDPDQGYACGEKLDAEAARQAFEDLCNERKRPGPDGSPCGPPEIEEGAVFAALDTQDICKNPYAHVEPEACTLEIAIPEPDKNTWQAILAFGLTKLGGPGTLMPAPGPKPPPPK